MYFTVIMYMLNSELHIYSFSYVLLHLVQSASQLQSICCHSRIYLVPTFTTPSTTDVTKVTPEKELESQYNSSNMNMNE